MKRITARRRWVAWAAVALAGIALLPEAQGQSFSLVAKAQPDQWYTGLGGPYVPITSPKPNDDAVPKTNQDYIWSLTDGGNSIWFGTSAGTAAIAGAQISFLVGQMPQANENRSSGGILLSANEYGMSTYPGVPAQLRPYFGDWRPPKIYQYNPTTNTLTDRTPNDPLINATLGFRSAGSANGVVLFGGPSLIYTGICLFAFDANTGAYLGSQFNPRYSNIRRWINTPAGLYTSVLHTSPALTRGSVIRWIGTRANPFAFTTVGLLNNQGAYLAYHNDRLFVGTWQEDSVFPQIIRQNETIADLLPPLELPPLASIYMSPTLGRAGLLPVHAPFWRQVWLPTDYEPDQKLALGYSMGAMASYGDALYFGTLHYPNSGTAAFIAQYGYPPPRPPTGSGVPRNATDRSIIILRAKGLGERTPATFELLYGNEKLPVYTPDPDPMVQGGTWAMVTNNYGHAGIYGNSGFGNSGNLYTWSAATHNGKLYIGTFDLFTLGLIGRVCDRIAANNPLVNHGCGGDLWCFNNGNSPAVAISREGCGNPANHGIRNLLSHSTGLYFGTANSQNLLTNPNDNLPDGGLELRRLVEP
jgi:hypothetical protein